MHMDTYVRITAAKGRQCSSDFGHGPFYPTQ